jgi:ABC-type lipoprotein release transport system permease subunit
VSANYFQTLGVHPLLGRLLTTVDDHVRAWDPAVYGSAVTVLSLSATVVPARRAVRVDPALTLRHE